MQTSPGLFSESSGKKRKASSSKNSSADSTGVLEEAAEGDESQQACAIN